ncbi:hypothetical protein D554_1066 [Bordetella holmesii 30539]|uniref:DUF302 domain-containing protein n=1 Tax=Bordetella holmesii 1058 TaxID=1247648 RepID=A0ABP3BMQ3_9BORD|nr:hypothetical protein D560_1597 [Bordetella holmesii ATCC 51541]AIT26258.1 hypothetical protein D558_1586 [Bordetella holmesii 44057]EWM41460.1 hypothetical protein D556_1599 [Bordetella holmesii 41130]EWM46828.1 hypothetical protein D555_1609 [Bordetella holmesii 35009]EWM51000.1 hypothetical protein D557_0851 [Bordetella holmesii 70147]EXF89860.1 hypothetical protein D554_1066 [Bordetella holmesii 30539]EXX96069.1 hypothetical protein D559_3513 [Bordetella holmesii 1058]KAK80484.1 PF0362
MSAALTLGAGAQAQDALITFTSTRDVGQTVAQLRTGLAAHGMTVFAEIDHAAAAQAAGLDMPPTRVLIFGNPKAGTPLMLAEPDLALDLPLRVLVRERAGRVEVLMHRLPSPGLPADRQGGLAAAADLVARSMGQK